MQNIQNFAQNFPLYGSYLENKDKFQHTVVLMRNRAAKESSKHIDNILQKVDSNNMYSRSPQGPAFNRSTPNILWVA